MAEKLLFRWSRDQCSARRKKKRYFSVGLGFWVGLGLWYASGGRFGLGLGLWLGFGCEIKEQGQEK